MKAASAVGARARGDAGGFGGLFDAVEDAGAGGGALSVPRAPDGSAAAYRCVRTRAELDELLAELRGAPMIAVDTETTSTRPMRAVLCGLSFSTRPGTGWYVPVRSPTPEAHLDTQTVVEALRPILEDPKRPKCGHNAKYDLLVLRRAGVELRGVEFDSMIASYLIDASRSSHGMDALALALLNHTCIPISDLIGSGTRQRTFDTVPLDRAAEYAAEDADITLRLREHMAPQLRAMGLVELFRDLEMPLVSVLAELEWNGILVDPAELDRQTVRLGARVTALRAQIIDAAPRAFNPDSPKQLASILFNPVDAAEPGLGLKPVKRTKTGFSTDVEVLEKLAEDPAIGSPIPELLVEYRQLTKLVGTYLVALKEEIHPETRRIHASFNQTVAATGRLSSSDPNLQNIPIRSEDGREIRRAFIAPPGRVLISADYSQIELRLLAHLARDAALIEAFHAGADIHTAVAAQIHNVKPEDVTREQRNGAKMVNFGIIYGITPYGLARRLHVDNETATTIIDDYKRRFSGIATFLAECIDVAVRKGYVETMCKRRRPIPEIESSNPNRRALAERTAINSVVQGSAADLIKIAMVDLHARLSDHTSATPEVPGVRMLLQIHDELVFEADRAVAERAQRIIVERMERAMDLTVPLKVESAISENWFEGK
jgi:DNA polymerase-1